MPLTRAVGMLGTVAAAQRRFAATPTPRWIATWETTHYCAADRKLASVLTVSYALKIDLGPCLVVGRVSAHAAHYVSADHRWPVFSPKALQLVNDVLRSEGFAACTSPDGWKDSEDLVTSSHEQSLQPDWAGSIVCTYCARCRFAGFAAAENGRSLRS